MKLLDQNQMITLLEGAAADRIEAAERGVPVDSAEERHWLSWGVKEGFFHVTTVLLDGLEIGQVYWHVNDQNRFVVNAAYGQNLTALDLGVRKIARERGCRSIETLTRRPGMVRELCRRGYRISGVALSLPL